MPASSNERKRCMSVPQRCRNSSASAKWLGFCTTTTPSLRARGIRSAITPSPCSSRTRLRRPIDSCRIHRIEDDFDGPITDAVQQQRLIEFERFAQHLRHFGFREIQLAAPIRPIAVRPPQRGTALERGSVQNPFDAADGHVGIGRTQFCQAANLRQIAPFRRRQRQRHRPYANRQPRRIEQSDEVIDRRPREYLHRRDAEAAA